MKFKNYLIAMAASCGLIALSIQARAHTISVGSFNAGSPGSVTLVLGTYDHGSLLVQGSISLIAGPGIPPTVTNSFTSVLLSQPAGLVDGVNNFYSDAGTAWGSLPSDSYNSATNISGLGLAVNWMASTFTGLTAGTYTYQITGMTDVNWNNINSRQDNWTGTLVIPEASISGVPDGGSTFALLGLVMGGIVVIRRKFAV